MNDMETWRRGVAVAAEELAALPEPLVARLRAITKAIRSHKKAMVDLTESAGGGPVCRECGGGCCDSGKYHFTVVDLLGYLLEGKELFNPSFTQGRCPYLGEGGCMMEAEFRPFNCVTFCCERLEGLLPSSGLEEFYRLERSLRQLNAEMDGMFGNRFGYGLFANLERNPSRDGMVLFQRKA